jgi:dolichol-phosphate mannosyltransferase
VRSAWLVLPTYDERDSLEPVVHAALGALARAGVAPHVLVVDDDSPDGTGALAERLAAADPRVHVLHHGPKRGLGPAVLAGARRALAAGADLVLTMDADGSHDPADLPRLVAAAAGADLVLGSRYVPGGGTRDWGLGRRALSRAGTRYARAVLGVDVRDLTGGFKCFRRRVLEQVPLDDVKANGYVFQVELTFRALRCGFAVAEVPIVFAARTRGRSKMTAGVALEALWRLPAVRWDVARHPAPRMHRVA